VLLFIVLVDLRRDHRPAVLRCLWIAFGHGLTFMIGLQAFINIGVVTSVLPNKGMPLPFISYGGSNLVLMLVSVGLLVSISRFAMEAVPAKILQPV
jgi:cell division protein FtsW (lipid II flippase)